MRPVTRVQMALAAALGMALALALLVPLSQVPKLFDGDDAAGGVPSAEALPPPARVEIPRTGKPVNPPVARYPAASSATVRVPTDGTATAGEAPLRLSRARDAAGRALAADVSVEVLDQVSARSRVGDPNAATGFLLKPGGSTGAAPAKVDVTLDFSGFRAAFGGDYASRLRL
jgi:hypothetical protein